MRTFIIYNTLFLFLMTGVTELRAQQFSLRELNFEISDEGECRLIASPEATGSLVIPGEVMYDNTLLSVTSIGEGAFSGCSGLTSVSFPTPVTEIGRKAFYSCSALRDIMLGGNVHTIGMQAFDGCPDLVNIISASPTPPGCGTYVFDDRVYDAATLTVPTGTRQAYRAENPWNRFSNIEEDDNPGIHPTLTLMLPDGNISTQERYGAQVTLQFKADENWTIHSLTLNGTDVTSQMNYLGYFTTPPIYQETCLQAVFAEDSGVALPEDEETRVMIDGRRIIISGYQGIRTVCSADGLMLYKGNDNEITLQYSGTVIVTTGSKTFKFHL